MKRTISIIVLFLIVMMSYAQQKHLTFMGIPIDGNINIFAAKIAQKGMKPDVEANKTLPFGERRFHGLYIGRNVTLTVKYTAKTKTVYEVEIGFANENSSIINNFEYDFVEGVKRKYKNSYLIGDEPGRDKTIYIYNTNNFDEFSWERVIGILKTEWMTIHAQPKEGYSDLREKYIYTIKIYYIDKDNTELRDAEVTDDI